MQLQLLVDFKSSVSSSMDEDLVDRRKRQRGTQEGEIINPFLQAKMAMIPNKHLRPPLEMIEHQSRSQKCQDSSVKGYGVRQNSSYH